MVYDRSACAAASTTRTSMRLRARDMREDRFVIGPELAVTRS